MVSLHFETKSEEILRVIVVVSFLIDTVREKTYKVNGQGREPRHLLRVRSTPPRNSYCKVNSVFKLNVARKSSSDRRKVWEETA